MALSLVLSRLPGQKNGQGDIVAVECSSPATYVAFACGICTAFREGTPGVSKRHCSVSWNPDTGEFLVTDLNSSYGTYLLNGQRLEPNIPYHLKAGESFYVGENTNVLRVEVG